MRAQVLLLLRAAACALRAAALPHRPRPVSAGLREGRGGVRGVGRGKHPQTDLEVKALSTFSLAEFLRRTSGALKPQGGSPQEWTFACTLSSRDAELGGAGTVAQDLFYVFYWRSIWYDSRSGGLSRVGEDVTHRTELLRRL